MAHTLVSVKEVAGTFDRAGSTCVKVQVVCSCGVDISPYDRFVPIDQFNNDPDEIIATMGQHSFDAHVEGADRAAMVPSVRASAPIEMAGAAVTAKIEAVAAAKQADEDTRKAAVAEVTEAAVNSK